MSGHDIANARRGEIAATLSGRPRRLVLTLGALAELETAFGVDGLAGLGARFETGRLRAGDLAAIIGAGLRGAGETIDDAEAARLTHEEGLPGFVAVVASLLTATFGEAKAPPTRQNP
jgi:hypothetical protein